MRVFDTPISTNDLSIDRVLAAGLPVLLVFHDGSISPDLEQAMNSIARQTAGDLLVAKVNRMDNPSTIRRYGIGSTPAVVAVQKGQVASKGEGISASDLHKHANFLLGKGPKPEAAPAGDRYRAGTARSAGDTRSAQPGEPQVVTDATFEQEVLRAARPVLVDFWAPWCGPCRITEPIIKKLAGELAGRLNIVKLNVDENPHTAQRYGVQSIPTMMVVKNGQIIDRWAGALPEPALRSRLAPHIQN